MVVFAWNVTKATKRNTILLIPLLLWEIPSQLECLQARFVEDTEEDEHQAALNTTGDTCFLLEDCVRSERDFMYMTSCFCTHVITFKIFFIVLMLSWEAYKLHYIINIIWMFQVNGNVQIKIRLSWTLKYVMACLIVLTTQMRLLRRIASVSMNTKRPVHCITHLITLYKRLFT